MNVERNVCRTRRFIFNYKCDSTTFVQFDALVFFPGATDPCTAKPASALASLGMKAGDHQPTSGSFKKKFKISSVNTNDY